MAKQGVTKSLVAAAVIGLFATHAATAQQRSLPAGSTVHFIYFSTGSHELTPEDRDHIRDVAGMMHSTPAFTATIIGKADSVGSADLNQHLSQQRAVAVFEDLVYTNQVSEDRVLLRWTGERLPYISNAADEQAMAQNRMAAIIVSNDASHCP